MTPAAKRKVLISLITVGVCILLMLALPVWLLAFGPPVPTGWRDLAPGDTLPVARSKVPGLDFDHRGGMPWPDMIAREETRFLSLRFGWMLIATFDQNGRLAHIRAESENRLSHDLDAVIKW